MSEFAKKLEKHYMDNVVKNEQEYYCEGLDETFKLVPPDLKTMTKAGLNQANGGEMDEAIVITVMGCVKLQDGTPAFETEDMIKMVKPTIVMELFEQINSLAGDVAEAGN